MSKIIIADTGPLIALCQVDLLQILVKMFDEVRLTEGVLAEATHDPAKPGAKTIEAALKSGVLIVNAVTRNSFLDELSLVLDRGEAESLWLARHVGAVALIDERKGRRVAKSKGIRLTGTAAILIRAKRLGLIKEVGPYLIRLRGSGYRLSDTLTKLILQKCGEG